MKNTRTMMAALALCAAITAAADTVSSPDGKLTVDITCDGGRPAYSVDYAGKPFILTSPLGLYTNIGDFTQGLTMKAAPVEKVDEHYTSRNIKRSSVDYKANRRTFTFGKDGKPVMEMTFEVADNDVAFRYQLLQQGETLSAIVNDEATAFVMPDGTTTFLCPQSEPMKGWKRTYPSYETDYTLDDTMGKNGEGYGYTFPALFHNGDKGWTLISETGVDGLYCGARLEGGNGSTYKIAYPLATEMNGLGWSSAGLSLPGYTPWRLITVGDNLAPVVETTAPFNVVEQLYEPSVDYKGTRGLWSWIIGQDNSVNFDEQIRYIDAAARMGYETILVDGLWDKQIGREKMEEIARYARSKGVDLYVWYNSNGYWNDAPQGPRNIMNNSIARKKEMKWLRDMGVKGIKVDFFGGDKQPMMQLYQDILSDANDYGIRVIFHGCTLPRGWERMFPNYASSEAVLASENLNFRQDMCDAEAVNAATHPFIRNTYG
ncbi:MAG: glycoside hydrolase family 97 N-terminal domain-containing protein, partial [Muribaculaceae bacterium]|nr:glycoside hydrolase family 97 N-terminal domain-containing protein [Muribaculaceae bacterium]